MNTSKLITLALACTIAVAHANDGAIKTHGKGQQMKARVEMEGLDLEKNIKSKEDNIVSKAEEVKVLAMLEQSN